MDKIVMCARCRVEPKTKHAAYCAPCFSAYRKERRRKRAEANPVDCAECGEPFVKLRSMVVTCSEQCRTDRARRLAGRPQRVVRRCDNCAEEFLPVRTGASFCSRQCYDAKRNAQRVSERHHLTRRDYARAYHAENRERIARRAAEWRAANQERHREISRAWYHANKHKTPESWRSRNPHGHAAKERVRRSRMRSQTPAPLAHEAVLAKVAYWGGKCWICRAPYEAIDHVKPIAAGGLNILANLRPICRTCNSRKGGKWFGAQHTSLYLREQ